MFAIKKIVNVRENIVFWLCFYSFIAEYQSK